MASSLSIYTRITYISAAFFGSYVTAAQAQIIVGGEGPQRACYEKAFYGDQGSKAAIDICNLAVKDVTSRKNKTASHVNRGILFMRKGDYPAARADFEAAIKLKPKLAKTYVNYGAVLIHMQDYDGAIEALNLAVQGLKETDIHEALFNRALAYDRKKQYKSAYLDLKRALELRPDWSDAQRAINNYKVETKPDVKTKSAG